MSQIKVTIVNGMGDQKFEVALPNSVPMNQLVPQLMSKLGITNSGSFTLQHKATGNLIAFTDTLETKNIINGDILRLVQAPSAGGLPVRSYRDLQLVEAVLNNDHLINSADGSLWFGVILYTDEDENLVRFVRLYFRELLEMSGDNCLFFIIEKPDEKWIPDIKEKLGSLGGKYFDALWERLGTETFQPFDRVKSYEIARQFNVKPSLLPCVILFTELKTREALPIAINSFIKTKKADNDEYTAFFRTLFSCVQSVSTKEKDALNELAKNITRERRKQMLKEVGSIEPTKLTTSLIEIIGTLIKAFVP